MDVIARRATPDAAIPCKFPKSSIFGFYKLQFPAPKANVLGFVKIPQKTYFFLSILFEICIYFVYNEQAVTKRRR